MSPVRVQRKRTKGWKAPLCSCGHGGDHSPVYVGRGSSWGNPWKVGDELDTAAWGDSDSDLGQLTTKARLRQFTVTPDLAVALYRAAVEPSTWEAEYYLRGHDLMCWCPLDQPCHADVLLDLANRDAS